MINLINSINLNEVLSYVNLIACITISYRAMTYVKGGSWVASVVAYFIVVFTTVIILKLCTGRYSAPEFSEVGLNVSIAFFLVMSRGKFCEMINGVRYVKRN